MNYHKPVLLQATTQLLAIRPGAKYIDATLGGGGHTNAILQSHGQVLGLDQDQDAINFCKQKFTKEISLSELILKKTNFVNIKQIVKDEKWQPIMGIIFDLGMSSHHIDTASRGFSFQSEGPLDMRMDQDLAVSAAEIVNNWPENTLNQILKNFGELSNANYLTKKIIQNRPYKTTLELASIVGNASRQVFQALRIVVNDELGSLSIALEQSFEILSSNGRIAVITFHSLEDRIVKKTFQNWSIKKQGLLVNSSPIVPSQTELADNSRAKSAKLRVLEKI